MLKKKGGGGRGGGGGDNKEEERRMGQKIIIQWGGGGGGGWEGAEGICWTTVTDDHRRDQCKQADKTKQKHHPQLCRRQVVYPGGGADAGHVLSE